MLMGNTFFIIDDDINIRKMLTHIILKNNMGKVVAELSSGDHAAKEIVFYNPDIVLIDLLLPVRDGIQIMEAAKAEGYQGKFIMISQVEDENIIAKAYEKGIIFFIGKPINSVEVISVIKGVCHNIELERSMLLIKNAVININQNMQPAAKISTNNDVSQIFTDIGIISETGSKDLMRLIQRVMDFKRSSPSEQYLLQDFYREIAEKEDEEEEAAANARTIEQRIRRVILKALENIALLGHDDYYNDKFVEYGAVLFDFKQVKQEIRYIENPQEERGKINIRKFIEGIISKLKSL